MALSFAASLDLNIARVQREINDKVYRISIELFLAIVAKTPSPLNKGYHATGLLVNQWYPMEGGFSSQKGSDENDNGAGSRSRILALRGGTAFLGKDGRLTLSNNIEYAYRAEMLGWPAPNWSGKSGSDGAGGPYRMVALALQEIAARYK